MYKIERERDPVILFNYLIGNVSFQRWYLREDIIQSNVSLAQGGTIVWHFLKIQLIRKSLGYKVSAVWNFKSDNTVCFIQQ